MANQALSAKSNEAGQPCCRAVSHLFGEYLQPLSFSLLLIHYFPENIKHTMLDSFEILTTSGVVLWSRSYTENSDPSIINSLISSVFIEEKTLPGAGIADDISAANNPPFKRDQHTLKWTTVKELGLIFVVSSPSRLLETKAYSDS